MSVSILTIMPACGSIPKSLKNSFTYCYDGRYTGLDKLINIYGYYCEMSLIKRSPTVGGFLKDASNYYIDTIYNYFMFYENGIFVYNIRDTYNDNTKKLVKRDVTSYLKDFTENSESLGAKQFYMNFWGSYIICGDTIKVQKVYKAMSLNDSWALREDWYLIIDRNTLLCINSFNLPTTIQPQPAKRAQHPITFSPIQAKPQPYNSWILKEKWFWRYENDWMNYMRSIENNKRRKR